MGPAPDVLHICETASDKRCGSLNGIVRGTEKVAPTLRNRYLGMWKHRILLDWES